MIDVVLIHPGGVHGIFPTGLVESSLVAREQPLWCRILASYLLDHDCSAMIIDQEAENLTAVEVAQRALAADPKLVVIVAAGHQPSASTQSLPGAREVAVAIRAALFLVTRYPRIIMTGNHPSALPKRTLIEETAIDYVIDGEGPLTIEGLLRGDPLENIPGLVWRYGDAIIQNERAPLLNLDKDLHGSLAWHLLPSPSRYMAHQWQCLDDLSKRTPYAAIHTTLGCRFACTFCMINVFQHGSFYRKRSPRAVVDEMLMLNREHGVETFKIIDELFILDRSHYTEICRLLIESGLGNKINCWAYSRTDSINETTLSMLRDAGVKWLALGIESSEADVQTAVAKRQRVDVRSVIEKIRGAGINIIGNYIFGLPSETATTMQATLDLAIELRTEWANFYTVHAYPGSPLYDEVTRDRPQDLPPDWRSYSMHNRHTVPLRNENLTAAEILAFRDAAFTRYFTDPNYLAMIKYRFGSAAIEHISQMTVYKLKRDLLGDD